MKPKQCLQEELEQSSAVPLRLATASSTQNFQLRDLESIKTDINLSYIGIFESLRNYSYSVLYNDISCSLFSVGHQSVSLSLRLFPQTPETSCMPSQMLGRWSVLSLLPGIDRYIADDLHYQFICLLRRTKVFSIKIVFKLVFSI